MPGEPPPLPGQQSHWLGQEAPNPLPSLHLLRGHASDFHLLLLLLLLLLLPPHTPWNFQSSSHTPGLNQPVCVQPGRSISCPREIHFVIAPVRPMGAVSGLHD